MPSITDSQIPVALAVLSVIVVAYSLIIAQQILLGVVAVGLLWFAYVCYLLANSLARIASSLERIADQRAERQPPEWDDDER